MIWGYRLLGNPHILIILESYFKYLFVMFFWQERLERPAGLNEQVGRNDFLEKRNVSPKLTATAPENRPKPKRKRSYSSYLFSGANCSFARVVNVSQKWSSNGMWTSIWNHRHLHVNVILFLKDFFATRTPTASRHRNESRIPRTVWRRTWIHGMLKSHSWNTNSKRRTVGWEGHWCENPPLEDLTYPWS